MDSSINKLEVSSSTVRDLDWIHTRHLQFDARLRKTAGKAEALNDGSPLMTIRELTRGNSNRTAPLPCGVRSSLNLGARTCQVRIEVAYQEIIPYWPSEAF